MAIKTQRVLVVGATGAQGGSVARRLLFVNHYCLDGPPYAVRALTRNPRSPAAKALAARGAEIAVGSLDDPASIQAALAGCDLVFGVTNYWEHYGAEVRHGRNLVDAVAASDVRHLVLSTLASATELSGGRIEVPHMDTKAAIERYARDRLDAVTFVHVAYYYENFLTWFRPQPQTDGTLAFGFPQGDTPLAAVSVVDVGPVVQAILDSADAFRGKTVGIVGDDRPPADYAAAMSRVLGRTVRYSHIDRDVFARLPFPGADDLAALFDLNRRFIPDRRRDLVTARRLHPGILTFDAWMAMNHMRFDTPEPPATRAA